MATETDAAAVAPPAGPEAALRADPSALREVLLAYAAVFLGTAVLGAVRTGTALDDVAQVGIAALFLGIPLRLARREKNGARRYGIDLSGLLEPDPDEERGEPGPLGLYDIGRSLRRALPDGLRELGFALLVAAVVFPPFVVGFAIWHRPAHGYAFQLPADFWSFAIAQFVLVGLPEEAFFRGFAQTRLGDYALTRTSALWRTRRILGADLSYGALLLQAALFAVVHLASEPRLDELATFFPGLLFAWMRARRGGIGAALAFHAFSNILAELLIRGWLS